MTTAASAAGWAGSSSLPGVRRSRSSWQLTDRSCCTGTTSSFRLAALQALYDAADDDSATGGPDIGRRIFPIVSVITEDGFERFPDQEAEDLSHEMVTGRRNRPDGPTVLP